MSTSTKYTICRNGDEVGTRSSKAAAVKFAEELHSTEAGLVNVVTANGTEVFKIGSEIRRPQRGFRFPQFTRVDETPLKIEDLKLPAGYVVAYRLPRDNHVILRAQDLTAVEKDKRYIVLNMETGSKEFHPTTRSASTAVYALRPAEKQPKQVEKLSHLLAS